MSIPQGKGWMMSAIGAGLIPTINLEGCGRLWILNYRSILKGDFLTSAVPGAGYAVLVSQDMNTGLPERRGSGTWVWMNSRSLV